MMMMINLDSGWYSWPEFISGTDLDKRERQSFSQIVIERYRAREICQAAVLLAVSLGRARTSNCLARGMQQVVPFGDRSSHCRAIPHDPSSNRSTYTGIKCH